MINPNRTYEFGTDPTWNLSVNMLSHYNSMKMKLSIILGVIQMLAGTIISLFNAIHFRKTLDIWCQFVPEVILMLAVFGYLCFIMFFKWGVDWVGSGITPPSLLNVMIQMFLSPMTLPAENQLFSGQLGVQLVLLFLAVISLPWMLLIKPFILRSQHKKKVRVYIPEEEEEEEDEEEEFDLGEVFVKQAIHTIEYVLGTVSNTASYLRLWALSLAHSGILFVPSKLVTELSIVFWSRVLMGAYGAVEGNVPLQTIMAWGAWSGWAAATFGVLLIMESLSAFLHALRLHWVEFQNKFYLGDGYPFTPFSYESLLSDEE